MAAKTNLAQYLSKQKSNGLRFQVSRSANGKITLCPALDAATYDIE